MVYCVTCANSKLQYVEVATRPLKERIGEGVYYVNNKNNFNLLQ